MMIDMLVFFTLSVLLFGFLVLAYLHAAARFHTFQLQATLPVGCVPEKEGAAPENGPLPWNFELGEHENHPVSFPAGPDIQSCSVC